MKLKFHSSVLFVKNIEVSKEFYCNILKQKIETDFGNNISLKNGLSLWQVPDWHVLNKDFYDKFNPNKCLELYFETDDINEIKRLIEKNHITIHHDLNEETWGQKTIRFYDPDNNLIEIGEKLQVFIKRMYFEELTIEEIYKKTGVPKKLIKEYIK
ncbi:MAG TPA: hypothetical protein DCG75_19450 [Bacteroidales bacterium]|jgi:catechol 2,3-dioxygenase-like lactoylglutathione lyase family enzyme|nr:hypothetical protein [Bacteroidales bacterium]